MVNRKDLKPKPDTRQLSDIPDFSPEARRKVALRQALQSSIAAQAEKHQRENFIACGAKIAQRVWFGVINDGTIHASNFAYMVLVALFPFFITSAALFALLGESGLSATAVNTVLLALPPIVADGLNPIAQGVISARTGPLLWIGGIVGLWTVGSLVETI